MALSVGEIGLDLTVNKNGFNRQMQSIQGIAKKAGVALAAAFSVKKLMDFGKKCIELGSDLEEVQNVVDVTFPRMTEQVDKFAKSAATSFGLSETMAKQYTGTFGAMAKAFGFTEEQAYDMGTTLTGLAGDVASFYNLSQDEAYTKLKSVFTGETETLKDLGVVMTQTALDSYAMANGWGKTTSAMSEAEKVALRYSFVQKQLSAAQGDFARTSDSWANQIRILKLQIDSIMATVGQGLINLLTPVIKIINTVISKIATLANAFKSLTELLTGNKSSPGKGLEEAAGAAAGLEDATAGVGNAAEKAAKKMQGLMSFDKLNNMQTSDSGSGDAAGSNIDFGALAEGAEECQKAEQKINPVLDSIIERLGELGNLFKEGFKAGLGDSFEARIDNIKEHLHGIKDSLIDIFTDPGVVASANKCADQIAYALGQVVGSVASVGVTIAQNILGGLDKYLTQNKEFLKQKLISIFDITGDIAMLIGEACESIAYIFEAIGDENGQQFTANIIGIVTNTILGVLELAGKLGRDILKCIVQPIIDNQEALRTAVDGLLGVLAEASGTLLDVINDTLAKANEVYDKYFKPFFDSFSQGLSELVTVFLEVWNTYVQPILDDWAKKFDELCKEHLQPLINNLLELIGKIVECLTLMWENTLKPLISWLIEVLGPTIADVCDIVFGVIDTVITFIADAINGIVEIIEGVIDILIGIATGDWKRVWNGFAEVIGGVADIIKGIINGIIGVVEGVANAVVAAVNTIVRAINTINFKVPEWVPVVGGNSIGFSIPEIPKVSIPRLAKGGVVSSPTLAMMGENYKKEAVVPLERNLEWRDAIADRIVEKTGTQGNAGIGLTADEMRAIMTEMVTMFAQLIGALDIRATYDKSEIYKAVKDEYRIESKRK